MKLKVNGVEHAFDDNGFCQNHGAYCSMAAVSAGPTCTCGFQSENRADLEGHIIGMARFDAADHAEAR